MRRLAAAVELASLMHVAAASNAQQVIIERLQMRWDESLADSQLACGDAMISGQQANMCNLVGSTFPPMRSAAGLLMAGRFRGFQPDGFAYSTEPNVPGIVADFTMDISRATSLADVNKEIAGTGQVTSGCTRPCLSYEKAVQQFEPSRVSTGFLSTSAAGIATPLTSALSPLARSTVTVQQVTWEMADDATVVDASPILMEFGALARSLTALGNSSWSGLRAGNYITADGACVTIVTFVHPWMDAQGWNQSADCISTRTYIFNSYLVQAYLQFPPVVLAKHPDSNSGEYTFKARDQSGQQIFSSWGGWSDPSMCQIGRRLTCGDSVVNKEQAFECTTVDQCWPDDIGDLTKADLGNVVLTLRRASIVALDITEMRLSGPDADHHGHYYMDGEESQVRPLAATSLLVLASLASSGAAEDLPWCGGGGAHPYGITAVPYVQAPDDSGAVLPANDCATWERLGWGKISEPLSPARTAAVTVAARPPALSGPAMLGTFMQASWGNMTRSDTITKAGTSIVSYGRATGPSLQAGVETVVQMAETLLAQRVAAELAVTDTTTALYGALVNVVFTIVALLATYTGRKDLLRVLSRAAFGRRVGVLAAHAVTALICASAVLLPPVLLLASEQAARAGNADGGVSQMTWVSAQASGFGDYSIVGLVSLRFVAVYDPVAYGLLWFNIALATAGTAVMLASMLRHASVTARPRPLEIEPPLPHGSTSRSWKLQHSEDGLPMPPQPPPQA
ncbi:hypothetical protein JKP88DRAFT_252141 [Tribonema minus]|uniref:TRP C-terminal domain-containing protein n=1 Tax=Tribonema minus TaxID=303371 RepID=A0A835ZBK7_9STRA|nr:hypothetical protein JKP88DRAFT_252141 [Tribonema minus]